MKAKSNPFLSAGGVHRSINRVLFTAESKPLRGYPALSGASIDKAILEAASATSSNHSEALTSFFNNPPQQFGKQLADAHGHKLGSLLLALKQGKLSARPEWGKAEWAFWVSVKRVLVGGGQMRGWFGERVIKAANEALANCDLVVRRSQFCADIGLVGLARCAPVSSHRALLFDFGQTTIKCALATFDDSAVRNVTQLFTTPAGCPSLEHLPPPAADLAHKRWHSMLDTIQRGIDSAPNAMRQQLSVCISIASYLQNGHPSQAGLGCYGVLHHLAPNLTDYINAELASRFSVQQPIPLLNDGAAAAASSDRHDVVLTLGTAIGIGFPEEIQTVRRLAEGFVVRDKMLR